MSHDFGRIFCKDHIDIHRHIHSILYLSKCESYPKSDFSIHFFITQNLSDSTECCIFFQKILSARFCPDCFAPKVVIIVTELSGNTFHGSIYEIILAAGVQCFLNRSLEY